MVRRGNLSSFARTSQSLGNLCELADLCDLGLALISLKLLDRVLKESLVGGKS